MNEKPLTIATNRISEHRLRELDGWRAVSVLLVILHHVGGFQHHRLLSQFPNVDLIVHYCGPLGVKIFFVISGFVICRLLISEESRYGSVSLRAFYYRRVFRILPPLYFYLVVLSLLIYLGLIHENGVSIVGAGLFLYDIEGGVPFAPHSWFVGHTWSLAVEEQFYLIFPTMWVSTPKAWRGWLFLGSFLLAVLWNLSFVYAGSDPVISTNTRAGFACIACGVLIAIHENRVRPIARGVPAFIVALAVFALLLHPIRSNSWQAPYESLFVPSAIGLVLLFSLDRGPMLRALLCSRPLQAVGLTSYGIYLWQQLFTAPRIYFSSAGQFIALLLPVLCLIVPASYLLIEKPAMHYGKALSRRERRSSMYAETAG